VRWVSQALNPSYRLRSLNLLQAVREQKHGF
jgi:hypothetical protein